MRLTKSEQAILDAFTVQRQRYPGRDPSYTAQGKRMIRAAESLARCGLAQIVERERIEYKSRGLIRASIAVKVTSPEEPKTEHAWVGLLRTAVKQSGRSDRELAKAAGLSQPTITRFRNTTRGLSFENAAKLASALGFSFAQ